MKNGRYGTYITKLKTCQILFHKTLQKVYISWKKLLAVSFGSIVFLYLSRLRQTRTFPGLKMRGTSHGQYTFDVSHLSQRLRCTALKTLCSAAAIFQNFLAQTFLKFFIVFDNPMDSLLMMGNRLLPKSHKFTHVTVVLLPIQ